MSTITLPNIRVGSDLIMRVRLKDNGVAIDWSTLSGIKAHLYSDVQRALAGRCDVAVDGEDSTLLVCRYAATKMQYLGENRIIVQAQYRGSTKTYDKPVVNFVRWTADTEGEEITIDDPDVSVEIEVEDVSSSVLDEAIYAALAAADRANDTADSLAGVEAAVEAAEALRVTAEEAREDAEEARAAAELARVDEEAVRVSAEDDRVSAENAREAAEDLRDEAEDAREEAEDDRADAEDAREAAEALRVTAEAARVTAETARVSQASADHSTATADHTQAESDHTQAASDHTTAAADHTQADADHTLAAADHVTAGEDHTQALADHEIVGGYNTRLTAVEGEVSQLEAKVKDNFSLPVATRSGYYNTNVSTGGTHSSSSTIEGVYMPCSPGDVFAIYGVAASSNYYRLYALYDSSQARVDRFANSGDYRTSPYVLTIPEGVAYVAINLSSYDATTDKILKRTSLADLSTRIDGADARIQEVNDKVIHLSYFKATFSLAVGEYGYKTDTKKIRYNIGNGVVDVPFYDGAVYRYGNNLYYWDASASEMKLYFQGIADDVSTLNAEMEKVGFTTTIFELSSLVSSPGDNYGKPPSTTYTNRARSKDFVKAPFKFSAPSGYRVYYVFSYALDAVLNTSNAVSARNYSSVSVQSINIQDDTKKYRIVLSKEDATQDVDMDVINTQSKFASGLFMDEGGVGFGKYYGCTNYPSHFTTYASLISAYDALVSKYPSLITKTTLGVDGQGVSICEYTIKSRTYNSEGERGTLDSVGDKPLIAIMAGVHGGETSTINGLYYLVRDILEGVAPVSTILGNINLRIIPCVCPYGFDNKSRTNANGVNINRNFDADWVYQGAGTNNYSGPSAASELETQIAQDWLQEVHEAGARLAVDWHNSGYPSEISCFCTKSNAISGTMDIKKNYLFSAYSIINVLRQCYKVPDTANWGYTSVSGGAGYSNTYMDKIGQLGCYFETSNDVDGAGTYTLVTDACNASVMGNVLIGLGELFKI